MEAVAEKTAYRAAFEEVERSPRRGSERIHKLRREAMERFETLGFPTQKQQAWRFTNVTSIARTDFRPAPPAEVDAASLASFTFDGCHRLVFVNGRFVAELSAVGKLPKGAVVGSLGQALEEAPEVVEAHLARHARFAEQPFVALNTAFLEDGAYVYLPKRSAVEEPIQLLFLTTSPQEPTVTYPRNLLVAEESAEGTVVETYASLNGDRHFTCPVSEVVVGANASVDHYKVQKESQQAFHVATFQLHQQRDSTFSSQSISTGGGLVRNDVNAVLDGEGCDTNLNGLYVVTGEQFVDNHMRVEHAKPHCTSHEVYRGILDRQSRAVFDGLIYVHPGAQKTDAIQSNKNLLLSRQALVNSNPQLEIFADDVRCTHGSTVGQLDEDAIFYLRSRGIPEDAARSLLTYAFASEIIQWIKVEAVRHDLEEFLFHRLPKGEIVREAV